jgi:hypothetical protein
VDGVVWFAQVPAALCLVGVVLEWCEESPTWLLVTGSYEQSRRSLACLQNIRGREAVEWQRSVHEATQASLGDSKGANIQPFSPFRHVEPRGDNIDRTPPKEVRLERPPATSKRGKSTPATRDTLPTASSREPVGGCSVFTVRAVYTSPVCGGPSTDSAGGWWMGTRRTTA